MKRFQWFVAAGLIAFASCSKKASFECNESHCGCTTEESAVLKITVLDAKGNPVAGVGVYCEGEMQPIAKTDLRGQFSHQFKVTRNSCGYERCGRLNLVDLSRKHDWYSLTLEEARTRKEPVTLVASQKLAPKSKGPK